MHQPTEQLVDQRALKNLHEILSETVGEKWPPLGTDPDLIEPVGAKCLTPIKREAAAICRRHGTTVSAFLRKCLEELVADYTRA